MVPGEVDMSQGQDFGWTFPEATMLDDLPNVVSVHHGGFLETGPRTLSSCSVISRHLANETFSYSPQEVECRQPKKFADPLKLEFVDVLRSIQRKLDL